MNRKQKIVCLVWHSVESDSINREFLTGWNPTASMFREQIRFLIGKYTPISIHDFVQLSKDPSMLEAYSKPPILVSFDDGFKNVIGQALPILKEFGVPALFFVIGEIVRNPQFVPWHVELIHVLRKTSKTRVAYGDDLVDATSAAGRGKLSSLFTASFERASDLHHQDLLTDLAKVLDVDRPLAADLDEDLRFVESNDLANLGPSSLLTVASHGMTHRFLDSLPYKERLYELEQSHDHLSRSSPSYFPALAYPGGSFNAATIAAAKQIYKCAFATYLGSYRKSYAYPRLMIGMDSREHLAYTISPLRLTYLLPLKRFFHKAATWRMGEAVKMASR